jgi:ATP-dependent RNA helicase RhlE
LADTILNKPEKVEVTPVSSTADTIQQALYYVEKNDKRALLAHILKDKEIKTALVFTRTKHGADKVVKDLIRVGITAEAIHGNKSQNARQRALSNFKNRTTRVLIATDIAARGIDIDELTHVINYELPNIPETYVHRIGRTGRAGASGIALSFCDEEEIEFLKDIHKLISKEIPVEEGHPYPMSPQSIVAKHAEGKKKGSGGGQGGGGQRGRSFGRADRGRGGSGKTAGGSGMSGASRGGNRDRGGRRD